ncbi:MAG: hypothetical protein O8C64_14990 [Candidatus Methanoperedens sp.]|nr:hypothetical protein [Candidatus Methanoperedens sp.]MCZ7404180.1 hypothetical protein [Candidatus Methanoperedens sp.]
MSHEESLKLDDVNMIKRLDQSGMYSYLCSISEDSLKSYRKAKFIFTFPSNKIKNIVGAGMGGSGMTPIAIGSMFKDELTVPYVLSQDYDLPKFVNSDTLLIAISDSGETEEVISQYYEARKRKAKIIIIGQRSKLIEIAKNDNIPYFDYSTPVPSRASFAFMFGSTLACLENIGVIRNNIETELLESITIVNSLKNEIGVNIKTEKNIAKKVALLIKTRTPILYIEPPFESLGPRSAKNLNENAQMLAFYNYLPEIRHNEMMGWVSTSNSKLKYIPILLRENKKYSKMEREIDEIKKLLNSDVIEFRAFGESKIARFYSLLYIMDMIAYYEAILINKDPSDTTHLKQLKSKLRSLSIIPYS